MILKQKYPNREEEDFRRENQIDERKKTERRYTRQELEEKIN